MAASFIRLYEENPDPRKITQVVNVLRSGGLIIYPSDTIYGLGCDIFNQKAVDKVRRIKNINDKKMDLAFVCYDLSHLSVYAKNVSTPVFKLMKKILPGPYTFILNASSKVPRILKVKKKKVGIRIPNNRIPREIVQELGNPIVTTSLHDDDKILEYATDPELIYEHYKNQVDLIIDGGYGDNQASTIIDYSGEELEIIREGKGEIYKFL
ncbi:MAG: L-threonylcarbamoyladenylate synthase [Cyclobacteriaceae bacterium]|jgi:tRNA threonylcarbamoyl adenosine modification protein (Sua5/YciO/YrdC/YwlC family)|nr:threonylcarbamoyl-AMP synthase [Flammeovirgaceae bacterium]MDG1104755.1 L-threonylcarbamoyladenylate synthase [Cyclobacteriaceae bacterium]